VIGFSSVPPPVHWAPPTATKYGEVAPKVGRLYSQLISFSLRPISVSGLNGLKLKCEPPSPLAVSKRTAKEEVQTKAFSEQKKQTNRAFHRKLTDFRERERERENTHISLPMSSQYTETQKHRNTETPTVDTRTNRNTLTLTSTKTQLHELVAETLLLVGTIIHAHLEGGRGGVHALLVGV
jgi:hypothetical protein